MASSVSAVIILLSGIKLIRNAQSAPPTWCLTLIIKLANSVLPSFLYFPIIHAMHAQPAPCTALSILYACNAQTIQYLTRQLADVSSKQVPMQPPQFAPSMPPSIQLLNNVFAHPPYPILMVSDASTANLHNSGTSPQRCVHNAQTIKSMIGLLPNASLALSAHPYKLMEYAHNVQLVHFTIPNIAFA